MLQAVLVPLRALSLPRLCFNTALHVSPAAAATSAANLGSHCRLSWTRGVLTTAHWQRVRRRQQLSGVSGRV